ncbi:MAG: DUF2179 domain-containing protein [bacterium]|nr:DUF2179 domain-containing protein [bacterium]
MDFFQSDLFSWVILPILIFLTRIVDVSLDTLRVIFIARGVRYLAPIIGFFEVLVWLMAISQIMRHLTNPFCYLGYAAGFATGNYVGMVIEARLALGKVILRVITKLNTAGMVEALSAKNYGLTMIDGEGPSGSVKIIFMLVPRQELTQAIAIVKQYTPNAFYSVEDVRFASEGIFPLKKNGSRGVIPFFLRRFRSEK